MPEPETDISMTNKTPADAAPDDKPAATSPGIDTNDGFSAETAVAAAKAEASANYDKFMRTAADLENFRRRTIREKEELRLYASSKVLEELLPVMDNLGLALQAAKQPGADLKALTGGVDMVLSQLKSALANHGLKEINPVGASFDANQHESISAQASDTVPEGAVVTVVRPGFSLNGRLLRPASVIVSSGSTKAGQ